MMDKTKCKQPCAISCIVVVKYVKVSRLPNDSQQKRDEYRVSAFGHTETTQKLQQTQVVFSLKSHPQGNDSVSTLVYDCQASDRKMGL